MLMDLINQLFIHTLKFCVQFWYLIIELGKGVLIWESIIKISDGIKVWIFKVMAHQFQNVFLAIKFIKR